MTVEQIMAKLFQVGLIQAVDNQRYTVNFTEERDGELINHPITGCIALVDRAGALRSKSNYSIGEQVLVLFASGFGPGVIMGALPSSEHRISDTTSDNHLIETDQHSVTFTPTTNQLRINLNGGHVLVENINLVTFAGNLQVNGAINSTGDIASQGNVSDSVRSMAADRGHYHIDAEGRPTDEAVI